MLPVRVAITLVLQHESSAYQKARLVFLQYAAGQSMVARETVPIQGGE
jgi:hypothetical protein